MAIDRHMLNHAGIYAWLYNLSFGLIQSFKCDPPVLRILIVFVQQLPTSLKCIGTHVSESICKQCVWLAIAELNNMEVAYLSIQGTSLLVNIIMKGYAFLSQQA